MVRINPDAYSPDVATILNNLAILYTDTRRPDYAETSFIEAVELYRDLAYINPDAYRPFVASVLSNLANLYRDTSRLDRAVKAALESIELLEPFYQRNPDGQGDLWAKSHTVLASIQQRRGDCTAAMATVVRAREIVGWEMYAHRLQEVEDNCKP